MNFLTQGLGLNWQIDSREQYENAKILLTDGRQVIRKAHVRLKDHSTYFCAFCALEHFPLLGQFEIR